MIRLDRRQFVLPGLHLRRFGGARHNGARDKARNQDQRSSTNRGRSRAVVAGAKEIRHAVWLWPVDVEPDDRPLCGFGYDARPVVEVIEAVFPEELVERMTRGSPLQWEPTE